MSKPMDPNQPPAPNMVRVDFRGRVEAELNLARGLFHLNEPLTGYQVFQICTGLALLEQVTGGMGEQGNVREIADLARSLSAKLSPILRQALDNNRRAAGLAPLL